MVEIRRPSPQPPSRLPEIQFTPGLAKATLRELAPLLAKEGIDVETLDVPDSHTLQQALDRAVERQIVRSSGAAGISARDMGGAGSIESLAALCRVRSARSGCSG